MTCSAVIHDSSSAIARGRGHSLPTSEANQMTRSAVILDSSSVFVNITQPDWLYTHTPPALILRNVSPPFFQR